MGLPGLPGINGRSTAVRLIGNVVIGGNEPRADYNAPVGETRVFQLETVSKVSSVWYVPVDNIPDLVKFQTILVGVNEQDRVSLTIKPNAQALLRILIFADID